MEIIVEYYGIDDWNRPIFRSVDKKWFFGDTENLFDYGESFKEIKKFYNNFENISEYLTYFGRSFNCEPLGIPLNNFKDPIKLIVKEK